MTPRVLWISGVLFAGTLAFFVTVPTGAANGEVGLRVGWTEAECLAPAGAAGDADADGVRDGCGHALARAFAPVLVFDARECECAKVRK